MTRLLPLWSQSGSYPATTDRQLIGAALPLGVVGGMAPSVVPSSMQIQIAAGQATVPDTATPPNGAWLCSSDASENVAIASASTGGSNRIDLVTVAVTDATPSWAFNVIQGTTIAGNPTPPAVPAGQIAICSIAVPGASAVLTAANLTDLRMTQLPANPVDGARFNYQAAPDIIWRLRYNAATGRWDFTGGPALIGINTSAVGFSAGSWVAANPTLTAPRAGSYEVSFTAEFQSTATATAQVAATLMVNGASMAATHQSSAALPAGAIQGVSRVSQPTTLAAGDQLQIGVFSNLDGVSAQRWALAVRPIYFGT